MNIIVERSSKNLKFDSSFVRGNNCRNKNVSFSRLSRILPRLRRPVRFNYNYNSVSIWTETLYRDSLGTFHYARVKRV